MNHAKTIATIRKSMKTIGARLLTAKLKLKTLDQDKATAVKAVQERFADRVAAAAQESRDLESDLERLAEAIEPLEELVADAKKRGDRGGSGRGGATPRKKKAARSPGRELRTADGVCDVRVAGNDGDKACDGTVHGRACGEVDCRFVAQRCAHHGGARATAAIAGGHRRWKHGAKKKEA